MDIILKILLYSIPIGLIIYLMYVFTTPQITDFCSNSFVVCMDNATKLPWCVLKNIGCVLSALV